MKQIKKMFHINLVLGSFLLGAFVVMGIITLEALINLDFDLNQALLGVSDKTLTIVFEP